MINIQEIGKLAKDRLQSWRPKLGNMKAHSSILKESLRHWARISFKKGTENRVQGDNSCRHTVDREQQLKE